MIDHGSLDRWQYALQEHVSADLKTVGHTVSGIDFAFDGADDVLLWCAGKLTVALEEIQGAIHALHESD